MKTLHAFLMVAGRGEAGLFAPVGPVSDRTPWALAVPCDSGLARPVGDRSYGTSGYGRGQRPRLQLAACGSEVRQNFEPRTRTESLGGFRYNRRRWLWLQSALSGLLVATLLAGCGSGKGSSSHATAAGHGIGSEPAPAVVFKAGRGLQLSPSAGQFIALATTEIAARDLPGAAGVPAVPAAALLRTVRGEFVFVANGGWYLRTPVRTGVAAAGWVEIQDGLYEGDTVVSHGTKALWLAEIQAVNGGVSCSAGH